MSRYQHSFISKLVFYEFAHDLAIIYTQKTTLNLKLTRTNQNVSKLRLTTLFSTQWTHGDGRGSILVVRFQVEIGHKHFIMPWFCLSFVQFMTTPQIKGCNYTRWIFCMERRFDDIIKPYLFIRCTHSNINNFLAVCLCI